MRSARSLFPLALSGCLALACSDGSGPGSGPALTCTDASTEVLAVGEHRILDPTRDDACVRLPAASPAGAEHLYVAVATEGRETENGVSTPYAITGSSTPTALRPLSSGLLSAFQPSASASEFHRMLRLRERALTENPSQVLFKDGRITPSQASPPVPGEQRTFKVCSSRECNAFIDAAATAKAVGQRVAIFVDNDVPAGGYTDPELIEVGNLFDDYLYPIDTVAFGTESDVDANGVVIVLLTHRVNELSPDCASSGSVVLGYFFGADLLARSAANPGSNEAEIFYGLVPDPLNPDCDISAAFAKSRLPATFIHEFQHMISFNQHVLVRGGTSEDTWLNEGLSHFAEELGGRQIPST